MKDNPKAVNILIFVNIAVFLFSRFMPGWYWRLFALIPGLVFSRLMVWQIFTYMFLHVSVSHVLFNMLTLWFFGQAVEHIMNKRRFFVYYFFTGAGAALCSIIFDPRAGAVVGASGAVFGVLAAYAILFPDSTVLLFFLFPVKAKYAVLIFVAVNLWAAMTAAASPVAYFAHLGGGLFGYLYFKVDWIREILSRLERFNYSDFKDRVLSEKRTRGRRKAEEDSNKILDKISETGMQSLTKKEREILNRRSAGKREDI